MLIAVLVEGEREMGGKREKEGILRALEMIPLKSC